MGLLLCAANGERHQLRARHLVGRGPACDLVLGRREVSSEHAVLRWTEQGWEIRDLGSRNGTWVNRERLASGEQRLLEVGAELAFGAAGIAWQLEDGAAPATCAVALATGEVRSAKNDLLALPSDEQPVASLYPGPSGAWTVEQDGAVELLADGQVLQVAGQAWQVFLAAPVELTLEPVAARPDIGSITLRFRVSRDEEHVSLCVLANGVERSLGSRSFHYTLLTLARQRLQDQAEGGLPASTHGWLYQDDLIRKLGTDANKFGVDVFRARRQLLDVGVDGAAGVVERRPMARQLRIGVANLEVVVE